MKIGVLVWENEGDEHPTLYPEGQEPGWAWRTQRIVYAEVEGVP